jgi:hypothetical protein
MAANNSTPRPWQQPSPEYDPFTIIGHVDGGYGDDGSQVRYTRICERTMSHLQLQWPTPN